MGLINFLKGVDIDKQRKQLFIDPFDKGSKTTVYNIGRNGSATILKVEDPKNVMLEKGTKTYTANGITYDIPTLEKKLGNTVDHFTFFVFDDTTIRDPDKTFIIADNSQLLHCKTYLIGPGFIYMPITQIDKVHLGLSTKQIHFTISPLGSWGRVSKLEIELEKKTTITNTIVKNIIWWFRDPICINNGCSLLYGSKFHLLTGFYPHGGGKYVIRFTCFNPAGDDTFIYWYINVNNFETLMSTNIENIKALI